MEQAPRVYRGEIQLPRGLCPLSPLLQQMLRMGHPFDRAIELTTAFAGSNLLGEAGGESLLTMGEHSAFPSASSPYVSTTTSLFKAVQFASMWNTREDGYVNVIETDAQRLRVDWFAAHENARYEEEVAVASHLTPEDIRGQITIAQLKLLAGVNRFDKPSIDAIEDQVLAGCDPFVPSEHDGPPCPVCGSRFDPYAWRYVSDASELLPVGPPEISSLARQPLAIDAELRTICRVGCGLRCPVCGTYLVCRDRAFAQPVTAGLLSRADARIAVRVANRSRRVVRMVNLEIRYADGTTSRVGWSPGNVIRDTIVPFDYLLPGEEVENEIDLGAASGEVSAVDVMAAGFDDGLGWFRLSEATTRRLSPA